MTDTAGEDEPPTELLASALQLMSQEWTKLSQGEDEAIAATADLSVITQRLTAMLLTRLVAVVHDRDKSAPRCYADYSTPTVCRSLLVQPELWPKNITATVVQELQMYVEKIVQRYYPTGIVPYHNAEHAYHVTLSMNKLLDMVLSKKFGEAVTPPSFGLRHQPMALFAMVFAALIHDVEHMGVGNRVLASEDNPLAIQYNDQSIAENRSLYVAFDELLCPQYANFRKILCPTTDDYHYLRKHVVNLVLNTDIASPEKTQLGRSKWKEAFLEEISRRRSLQNATTESPTNATSPQSNKPNTSLASLNIRGGQSNTPQSGNSSSDEQSMETFLTESDEGTQDTNEAVAEQAPPSPPRNNGTVRQRRMARGSAVANTTPPSTQNPKPILRSSNKKRLGIRRSMDLSGEVVDTYESKDTHNNSEAALREADQPDELKMTVVMEVLMQAADVAHNLQSWDHMVEWSCRLYLELRRAYIQGRGPDVSPNWFANQVGFLEMYLEPLAKKLETVGVFGAMIGPSFARIVKASRDRWLLDGMEVTQAVIDAGEEWYPEGESVEPLPVLPPRHGRNDANRDLAAIANGGASNANGETAARVLQVQDNSKIEKLEAELQRTKAALEQAEQAVKEEESNLKENLVKGATLQRALEDKEAALKALEKELAIAKHAQEAEKKKCEEESKKNLQQQEELNRKFKEQEDLRKKLQQQEEKQRELERQKDNELNRKFKEQEDLKKKLQQQEEKQRDLEREKDKEVQKLMKRQAEMQKLLQQQEEAQKRQLAEAEERRQEELRQKERALQKTRELEVVVTSTAAGAKLQAVVMILMGVALFWTNFRSPILNNLCAPAYPGTKVYSVESSVHEAPWFAPTGYKKAAFGICGNRTRMRVENSGGKLSWTRADQQTTPESLSKIFKHAIIESNHLSVVDKKGKLSKADAPWYSPI